MSAVEKIWLRHHAKKDSALVLSENSTSAAISSQISALLQASSAADQPLTVPPFVVTEMARFNVRRDRLLVNSIVFVRFGKEKELEQSVRRPARISKAILKLDKQIKCLEDQIVLHREYIDSQIEQEQEKKAKTEGKSHYTRLYQNQIDTYKKHLASFEKTKYNMMLSLVCEKIRLLEYIQSASFVQRDRQLLRIRYYYENLTRFSALKRGAFFSPLNAEVLYAVCDSDLLGYYKDALIESREQLQNLRMIIGSPSATATAVNLKVI